MFPLYWKKTFLDRHYVCRSHDPTLRIGLILWKNEKSHLPPFFSFTFFSFSRLFATFVTSFFTCISLRQLIDESCASPSKNLISLSYSMPGFSANLFRIYFFVWTMMNLMKNGLRKKVWPVLLFNGMRKILAWLLNLDGILGMLLMNTCSIVSSFFVCTLHDISLLAGLLDPNRATQVSTLINFSLVRG